MAFGPPPACKPKLQQAGVYLPGYLLVADGPQDSPKKVKFDVAKGVLDPTIADQIVTKITGQAPPPSVLKQFESGVSMDDYGYLKPAGLNRPDPNPNSAEATDNVCGNCVNCRRKACQECSLCKRGDSVGCIDR